MASCRFFALKCLVITAIAVCGVLGSYASGRAQQDDKAAATRHFLVALGLQNGKLYAQAEQRWLTFIKEYSKDSKIPHAHHYLGACYLHQKKFKQAADSFTLVVKSFPKFASRDASQFNLGLALYNLAQKSAKNGDYIAASKAFAQVPAMFPKSAHAASALYYAGESFYQAEDKDAAAGAYEKLIQSYANDAIAPDAYYALGTVRQEQKNFSEAAKSFQTFLQKFAKNPLGTECGLRLGQCLFNLKKYPEAAQHFDKAARVKDFDYADFALMQKAQCFYEQKQYPQAAQIFEQLPVQFAKSAYRGQAWLSAGKCWYSAGQVNKSQPLLQRVINEKLPESPEAAWWLGQSLLKTDKAAQAVQVAQKAINDFPKSDLIPELTFVKISGLHAQPAGRKQSIAQFADFSKKYAKHELASRALYMAALTALQEEQFVPAQQYAEEFLKNSSYAKDPLSGDVLFIAGESWMQQDSKNFSKAEPYYRKLIAEFPKNEQAPRAGLRVGLCMYLGKKYDAAITYLNQAAANLKDAGLKAEALFLIGRNHNDAKRRAQAIAAFEQSIQTKTNWSRGDEVLLALAESLRLEKKLDQAVVRLKTLAGNNPKSTLLDQAHYQLGEILYQQGKFNPAVQSYQVVISKFPKSKLAPLAQHGSGLCYFTEKKYQNAVDAFTLQIKNYAKSDVSPRSLYLRGLSQQQLKKYQLAVADLQAFLATKPDPDESLDARYSMGLCQARSKKHEEAIFTFRSILKDQPKYPQADKVQYELAFALLETDKGKEAADSFKQLATQFPKSTLAAESWFRVGNFYEDNKQLKEATDAYSSGLQTAKDMGIKEKLQYKLGWVYYQGGKLDDAAKILQQQITEFPKGPLFDEGIFLAGECCYRMKKFKEALPHFEKIIQKGVKKYAGRALYRSGACNAGIKQWANSEARYAQLVQNYPKFDLVHEARYGLGLAQQNQKKLDEAVKTYEQITKETQTETAAKSRFMIGEITFAKKDYKKAIEHFLEAALGYPYKEWQALSYFEAGRCFVQLKDIPKAISNLEKVVKKFPEHPRAKDAANLIEDLRKQQESRLMGSRRNGNHWLEHLARTPGSQTPVWEPILAKLEFRDSVPKQEFGNEVC